MAALVLVLFLGAGAAARSVPDADPAGDDFLWLEDVSSERALDWVKSQNARTLARLEQDARYPRLYAEALKIARAEDRIPTPRFLGGEIYNFWQDAEHARGSWRRTAAADFRRASPQWVTVLDLDALAQSDGVGWVWQGADCLRPNEQRCLLKLSEGGEDADTIREFDLPTRQFVAGGFELPRSKQSAAWVDQDHLLVARDWGPGTMSNSGYPIIVKSLERGESMAAARELFRGQPADVEVDVTTLQDADGESVALIERHPGFFETENYLVDGGRTRRLSLPAKSAILELLAHRLLIRLDEPWHANGHRYPSGALVAVDVRSARSDPRHLQPILLWAPQARESLADVGATRAHLIVTLYQNVRGRALIFEPTDNGHWRRQALDLPDNASLGIVTTDARSEAAYLSVGGFLLPSSLWLADTAGKQVSQIKQLPAAFDASADIVEQRAATSADGTRVPYFLVRSRSSVADGSNPTILHAYGGFQVSCTPFYSAALGKLWLERGGNFALANIRGGGEFGPAWHEAGLKTHRQRIYDDFAAVGRDLIDRHFTSPRRLGIVGGSNGGLLMGVELTQHPELWNAVDIQVPLLDMLRFESIAAGASWVGEYGSVADPAERSFLRAVSPYQNLRTGVAYPEPFVWTSSSDDRVGPQHARKFAAKLAAMGLPYLFYEEVAGGHAFDFGECGATGGTAPEDIARMKALEAVYFSQRLLD